MITRFAHTPTDELLLLAEEDSEIAQELAKRFEHEIELRAQEIAEECDCESEEEKAYREGYDEGLADAENK